MCIIFYIDTIKLIAQIKYTRYYINEIREIPLGSWVKGIILKTILININISKVLRKYKIYHVIWITRVWYVNVKEENMIFYQRRTVVLTYEKSLKWLTNGWYYLTGVLNENI